MKTAIELLIEERNRQIAEEGWHESHDDEHDTHQLACAAAAYAWPAEFDGYEFIENPEFPGEITPSGVDRLDMFPFHKDWWKPTPNDRIKELVKAGALIVAEIERLQRIKTTAKEGEQS